MGGSRVAGWRVVRKPQTLQDALDNLGVEDEGDQLAPSLALVAAQHIDAEHSLHQFRVEVAIDGTVPSPIGTESGSLGSGSRHDGVAFC